MFRAERAPDGASATFSLEDDDTTRAQYPFDFTLSITFRLDGRTLFVDATVRNDGEGTMPFAYGGHPGFNVPLGGEGDFGDWFLEFAPGASPDAFEFGDGGLITGRKHAMPLAPGGRLPLRHELFNGTGLFLDRSGGVVSLRSETSKRSVTVRFPDMPNVGFWHSPGEAAFLCIEPWAGLPSYDGVADDFATRPNMARLAPGAEATLRYSVEFN
jgi:galactose mutarotase-like enzyme